MAPGKPATRLGRPAEGLPRYYLDVGWWRHPSFDDLSAEALFVWQAAVSYAHEHLTDGRLPSDPDRLSIKLGVRLAWARKARRELLAAGRWREVDGALEIVGYLEHNPSKDEVRAWSAERSARGSLGNHLRWHEARNLVDPACPHCAKPAENRVRMSENASDSQALKQRKPRAKKDGRRHVDKPASRSNADEGDRYSDRSSDSVSDRKRDRMGWDRNNPPSIPPYDSAEQADPTPASGGREEAIAALWPDMARRKLGLARQVGTPGLPPPGGRREARWLEQVERDLADTYTESARAIWETQPARPADYVIAQIDPALAERADWSTPDRAETEQQHAARRAVHDAYLERTTPDERAEIARRAVDEAKRAVRAARRRDRPDVDRHEPPNPPESTDP